MEIIDDPLQLFKTTLSHIDSAITGVEQRLELYPNPSIRKSAESEIEHLKFTRKRYSDAIIDLLEMREKKESEKLFLSLKTRADVSTYSTLLSNHTIISKRLEVLRTKEDTNQDELNRLTKAIGKIEKRLKEITDKYIVCDVCTEVQPRLKDDKSDPIVCDNCGHRIR